MTRFHERFTIVIGAEDARRRFVNRAHNLIFDELLSRTADSGRIAKLIVSELGERYDYRGISLYIGDEFLRVLEAIEGYYRVAPAVRDALNEIVSQMLASAEVDLGVRWQDGRFLPVGVTLLDDALVNDPLHWLRNKGHDSVLGPFEKGLAHLLRAHNDPAPCADVTTDMYEALEALAQLVSGREGRDLSANRELFLSRVGASDAYKQILRDYIEYANQFRHASQAGARPSLSLKEAESFVYLTGLFIRLAMP